MGSREVGGGKYKRNRLGGVRVSRIGWRGKYTPSGLGWLGGGYRGGVRIPSVTVKTQRKQFHVFKVLIPSVELGSSKTTSCF